MQLSLQEESTPDAFISSQQSDLTSRNRLVSETIWLVRLLAAELLELHRFPIDREDLESCGMTGLVVAADAFDYRRGMPFTAFARCHIRGAMLDAIRDGHGASTRSETACLRELAQRSAQTPSAARLEEPTHSEPLTVSAHHQPHRQVVAETRRGMMASPTPEDLVERMVVNERVRAAIAALPHRERQIVELFYYHHDESYEAVARVLGHTRPHIFRIHARARARLRIALADLGSNRSATWPARASQDLSTLERDPT